MSGEIDSWAIRWYWSVFKNNGCVVYPPTSYVNNIGFDGSGTHGGFFIYKIFNKSNSPTYLDRVNLPTQIFFFKEDLMKVKRFLFRLNNSWIAFIKNNFKQLFLTN